ncbi:MAG TPA: NADH-quinone oxidoreductase subunit C [Candidatus Didemnitutus sp.]|nr:NADH-quinone oxidoreductase subunit C [Candidatus Didemnitutus sp.]
METLEQIRDRIVARFPGATVELVTNPGPAAEHSLRLDAAHAREIALFLRDEPALQLDYCSNATGVDWPEKEIVETVKKTVPDPAGGAPKVVEEKTKRVQPGCLEAVYHLYSMALRSSAPVIIRLRTGNRTDQVTLPSLTPVWRSCDFQEREIFDLYGIVFEGHPDLRRILMWDEFKDHPMRKDYVAPDDFEWEPTPHGDVHTRAKAHYPPPPAAKPQDGPSVASAKEGKP